MSLEGFRKSAATRITKSLSVPQTNSNLGILCCKHPPNTKPAHHQLAWQSSRFEAIAIRLAATSDRSQQLHSSLSTAPGLAAKTFHQSKHAHHSSMAQIHPASLQEPKQHNVFKQILVSKGVEKQVFSETEWLVPFPSDFKNLAKGSLFHTASKSTFSS